MEEKYIEPNESLSIIQHMINKAQRRYSDDSFYYIMWGSLVLAAALAQFILLVLQVKNYALVWMVLPVGALISVIYGAKQKSKEKTKTYVDTYMGYLWIAMGVAMLVVLVMMPRLGFENAYPVLILIYGVGTFVSGGLLSFRPLLFGGIFCFILSVGAFFVPFPIQSLFIAVAMLVSYIIPGFLLKAKFKH